MAQSTFRYHAFISYALADQRGDGRKWANWLHYRLENFVVPASLAGRPTPSGPLPSSLFPVYLPPRSKPTSEQATEPLSTPVRKALEQSRVLIVLCSPEAAQSPQVNEEIRYFKQLGRERILAFIIAGDPESDEPGTACYPEALRHDVRPDGTLDREWVVHPVAADARLLGEAPGFTSMIAVEESLRASGTSPGRTRDAVAAYEQKLQAAWVKILGGVFGGSFRELSDPASPGSRRGGSGAARAAWTVTLLTLLGAGALAWLLAGQRTENQELIGARRRADALLVWLQRDQGTKLAQQNQMLLWEEANRRLAEHFTLLAQQDDTGLAPDAIADALAQATEIQATRTNFVVAAQFAQQAVAARQKAIALKPNDPELRLRLLEDHRRLATQFTKTGKKTEALKEAEQARRLVGELSAQRPGDVVLLKLATQAAYEAGDLYAANANAPQAMQAFEEGHALAKQLVLAAPEQTIHQGEVAQGEIRLGRLQQQEGKYPGALARFQQAKRLLAPLVLAHPADRELLAAEAVAQERIAAVFSLLRQPAEAVAAQRLAMERHEQLSRLDPTNPEPQYATIGALSRLADFLRQVGPENRTEALTLVQRGLDQLAQRFPDKLDTRANLLRTDLERVKLSTLQ